MLTSYSDLVWAGVDDRIPLQASVPLDYNAGEVANKRTSLPTKVFPETASSVQMSRFRLSLTRPLCLGGIAVLLAGVGLGVLPARADEPSDRQAVPASDPIDQLKSLGVRPTLDDHGHVYSLTITRPSQEVLSLLADCPSLTKLKMHGRLVTDDHLGQLAGLEALKELSLQKSSVTDEGIQELASKLPGCRITY